MKIAIDDSASDLGIDNAVIARISDVRVVDERDQLKDQADKLMRLLHSSSGELLERASVRGYRELFAKLGYPDQQPAGERLVQGFLDRGFRSFNNIVDSYNIVAARHASGLGLHDGGGVRIGVRVLRSTGEEEIRPMFRDSYKRIREGDLLYSSLNPDGSPGPPLAWLGKRDVDSEDYRVKDATHTLLLVVLGNSETSLEHNELLCHEVYDLIRITNPRAHLEIFPATDGG